MQSFIYFKDKYIIMLKKLTNSRAVSELLGTILLLGISVSLFSVVYVSFFAVNVESESPNVDIIGTIHENQLILEHSGGEDIDLDFKLLVDYSLSSAGVTQLPKSLNYSDSVNSIGGDGKWTIGEKLVFDLKELPFYDQFNPIDIILVDPDSNSAIMMGTLKESKPSEGFPADLGITSLYCDPNTVSEPGLDIDVFFSVKNYGQNASNGFNFSIYADENLVSDGTKYLNELEPNEQITFSESITLPTDPPIEINNQYYSIKLEIDIIGTEFESDGDGNSANNIKYTPVNYEEDETNIADLNLKINLDSEFLLPNFYNNFNFDINVKNEGPKNTDNIQVKCEIPCGLGYKSARTFNGTYDEDKGIWSVGKLENGQSVNLSILTLVEPLEEEVEFTQFAIVIDGSDTISDEKFSIILKGIGQSIRDGSIPHNNKIELTIIQFGLTSTTPSYTTRVELRPTVITKNNYELTANSVEEIKKMGGDVSPFLDAIKATTFVLTSSENFDQNNVQLIDFISDGVLGDGEYYSDIINERDKMIQSLNLTEDQDQINIIGLEGNFGCRSEWLKNFVWPQPGYDNWPPTGTGWFRLIDDQDEIISCLGYQIEYMPIERKVSARIINSDVFDDDTNNNYDYKIIIPN